MTQTFQPTALITGASKGLGRALAEALTERGWRLVVDARRPRALGDELPGAVVVAGDISDPAHRRVLATAVDRLGRLDLLVNNASDLGPSPLPPLADYPLDVLRRVYDVDVLAPIALTQAVIGKLRATRGVVLNVSSDAAVEAYAGWGGDGSGQGAPDPPNPGPPGEGARTSGDPG